MKPLLSGPQDFVMVRFCCICGQRNDEPYGNPRCISPNYDGEGGYDVGKHVWGNPEKVKVR